MKCLYSYVPALAAQRQVKSLKSLSARTYINIRFSYFDIPLLNTVSCAHAQDTVFNKGMSKYEKRMLMYVLALSDSKLLVCFYKI